MQPSVSHTPDCTPTFPPDPLTLPCFYSRLVMNAALSVISKNVLWSPCVMRDPLGWSDSSVGKAAVLCCHHTSNGNCIRIFSLSILIFNFSTLWIEKKGRHSCKYLCLLGNCGDSAAWCWSRRTPPLPPPGIVGNLAAQLLPSFL